MALRLRVDAVGEQDEHTALPYLADSSVIGGARVYGCRVELEVSRVHHSARAARDRQPDGIRDTVRDTEGLNSEPSDVDDIAVLKRVQLRLVQQPRLAQLHLDETAS